MYVRLKSSFQIVTLPDDFLTLKEVTDDTLEFDVKYLFDQEQGIKQNATKITLDVSKTLPPQSTITVTAPGPGFAKSILTARRSHVEAIRAFQINSLIRSKNSDPTTSVSNEIVHLFTKGYTLDQLPQARKRRFKAVPTAKAPNALKPVHVQHDVGEQFNGERQLAEDILALGVDPSESYQQNDLGLTIQEAHSGFHKKSPVVFDSRDQKLLYRYKNLSFLKPIATPDPGMPGHVIDDNPPVDQLVMVPTQEAVVSLPVVEPVKFNFNSNDPDRLYLTVKVSDTDDVVIQTITRAFNPRDYIKFHSIPTLPPFAKTTGYGSKTHALLTVKQRDKKATSIKVYRRVYDHHTLEDQSYTFVSEFNITITDGWKYVPLEVSLGNTFIYRVIAIGNDGSLGSGYETVVLKPTQKDSNIKRVVVTTTPILNGVELDITHLPSDCVSFQLLREDTTTLKGTLEVVSTPIYVETSDPNRAYTIQDTTVKRGHVYRYYCRLYRKNGSHFRRLVTLYEHFPLVENLVDTKLVDVRAQLTDLGYDVKFTIQTAVVSTDLDQYKLLLQRQGLYDLFASDVKDARDQLGKLIAHNVRRVDLTTGAVEDFGTVTSTEFSDLTERNVAGVSDPVSGRKYRYVVTALLRAPETMLDTFVKTSTDATTGRSYNFSPFKFLHPVVAAHGNLVSNSSLRSHYSSDPMTFGVIGNYTSAEVALDTQFPNVTNLTREKFGSDVDVLKWSLRGSPSDVDHFQILVERSGKRTIVGRSICLPDAQTFQFVRWLHSFETDVDLRYYVLPIFHDFTRGAPIQASNVQKGTEQ
jgi:hypothetical protein